MKNLIIIGVGGFAREVYWHAQDSVGYNEEFHLKGFLDGDVKLTEDAYKKLELPVLGDINSYEIEPDDVFICAVADTNAKEKLVNIILQRGGKFINLIHNTAIVCRNAKIGIGNILCPRVHINDHCTCGNYVTFNGSAGMGHDAVVGDYSSFMGSAGLCGNVKIGKRVYLATGALVLPHGVIEDDVYIGVHSVVFKHVRKGQKVFGNPAMPI